MKSKNKLSIFALQHKLSRPLATIVLIGFSLGYLLYLVTLLIINAKKGWFTVQFESIPILKLNEIYTFEYYFMSYNYSNIYSNYINASLSNSTTPFLLRSEIIFFMSIVAIVIALTISHIKMDSGSGTTGRLSLSDSSIKTMQWLSDFIHIVFIWLIHIIIIFLFYVIYMHFAPAELKYPQNLYMLFASEGYLYLLFPILNPVSLIRMISLITAVSFLPSIIADIFSDTKEFSLKSLIMPILPAVLICLAFFASSHIWSIIAGLLAMFACIIYCKILKFTGKHVVILDEDKANEII